MVDKSKVSELTAEIAERAERLRNEAITEHRGPPRGEVFELGRFIRRLEEQVQLGDEDTLGEAC
jgi:hypothetical protein